MKKFCSGMRGFRPGFSLLEVLFTVLILAVLAAVAVPLYSSTKSDAETKACMSNVRAIATAESKYKFDNGAYTTTGTNLVGEGIAQMPVCPKDGSAYTLTLNGSQITITCSGSHASNTTTIQ